MINRWLAGLGFLCLIVVMLFCLYLISTKTTTTTEALLLSLFLTFLSIVGSWIASKYYSEYSFNKNQKLFALKASEKVLNLSNELERLSVFLNQELENEENLNINEALQLKDARIEGAIHIINTLKSVNDRSLSDWQGVIGDEIKAQREKQEEREKELQLVLDRLEFLTNEESIRNPSMGESESAEIFRQIKSLKKDISLFASQVGGMPIRRQKKYKQKNISIENKCPLCNKIFVYRQKPVQGIFALKCPMCNGRLISIYENDDFILKPRLPKIEKIICQSCNIEMSLETDPLPGWYVETTCDNCGSTLRVYRNKEGVFSKVVTKMLKVDLTEEIIELVRKALPAQPWPKGIHKVVGTELSIPNSLVRKAIAELIKRGMFKLQIDGELFIKES